MPVVVDQTTPTISPFQVFPSPKSRVEVAGGVVRSCYIDTSLDHPLPHQSKIQDLHLVLGMWTTKVHSLSKEGEAMKDDDRDLVH